MKGVDETITPSANYLFLYFSPDVSALFTQEALKLYNQTVLQKQMLMLAEKYVKLNDEVSLERSN